MPPVINTVLVPVDFSAGAEAAVEWAQAIAARFGAALVLLHVVDTTANALIGGPGGVLAPPPPALYDGLREEARRALDDLGARTPGARTLLREGTPRTEILAVAREIGADLIVMGTHGRTGLAHLLFGSVAEYVVRHAPVPVFTVRRRDPA
ncbi:MAG: universal stress protein [Armatimonadota bacterium]|nr:universal stress protein [Armatimonadota bacterium]MDR7422292.1 universal stress protein [Armatimonadota bacterium]MDR7453756.1 universal stress protein [Armatimonadota bacterium]MDR7456285.1 universal stress protein [Armatimonadota bacterium]MDR7496282.1 universal stress protein [Armatimonadota bacterium]